MLPAAAALILLPAAIRAVQLLQVLARALPAKPRYAPQDALGSTVMTTDASGEIASQFEYGDWGETTQVFGSPDLYYNPYRYTGQQFDGETGLYYLRARSYAPGLGRFTSRDPIEYEAGLNLYAYCGGDPLNWRDPSGLDIAIIISGEIATNPYGHSASAVTGGGVYSFGTGTQFGSSLNAYVTTQLQRRDVEIVVIKTTADQDRKALEYLGKEQDNLGGPFRCDTCATRNNNLLNHVFGGNIDLTRPGALRRRALELTGEADSLDKPDTIKLKKGSTPSDDCNKTLSGFEKK